MTSSTPPKPKATTGLCLGLPTWLSVGLRGAAAGAGAEEEEEEEEAEEAGSAALNTRLACFAGPTPGANEEEEAEEAEDESFALLPPALPVEEKEAAVVGAGLEP